MTNFGLIVWVLLLPLIGFLVQALLGGRVVAALGPAAGRRVMGTLAVLPVAGSFGIGVLLTMGLAALPPASRMVVVPWFDWIDVLGLRLPFEFVVDPLSMTMVLIITGVGSLIHLYATGYMAEERDYSRFFTYMNLFVAAMLILVIGNNLALLFIGWEGVGLCSYLLIGFWYKDLANSRAANKAFIVNRIGDWGLSLGLFLIVALLSSQASRYGVADGRWLSYDQMLPRLARALAENPAAATAIGLLLFVGAAGKSAQFPLYLWLPDAMAGPTPVSALIHAATMVTSGVVLLNRMHVVFELSPVASAIVAAIGAFTALFAALVAFGQMDIKKVLAYSTVSQLGFMFVAVGAGVFWAGMFHVTTHAFFKALLFLGAGAVIHAMAHNQDMRNYGGLRKYLPITFGTMVIGYLAISGIPPLAGFYSKEAIIGGALAGRHATVEGLNVGVISGWTALFVAFLTAMYMTRMTWLTFFGREERWRRIEPKLAHEGHDLGRTDEAHALHREGAPVADPPVSRYGAATSAEMTRDATGERFEETIPGGAEISGHGHTSDPHNFFFTPEEMRVREEAQVEAHEHDLDRDHTPHEVPPSMWIPLVVLAVLSAVGGWVLERVWSIEKWLYPAGLPILGEPSVEPEGVPLMALSIAAAVLGIVAGLIVYWRGLPRREGWDERGWSGFRRWAGDQFGYDRAMVAASVEGGGDLGRFFARAVDNRLIDGIVNGIGLGAAGAGRALRVLQNGLVRSYALLMLVGGLLFVGYFAYALNLVHVGGR